MELKLKVYITDAEGHKFMGIGVLWLLQTIEKERSIRGAAALLGISYSKAHNMLKTLEAELGSPVLQRRKGGDDRTGATLTALGKRLITVYDDFQDDLKQYAEAQFETFKTTLIKEIDHAEEHL